MSETLPLFEFGPFRLDPAHRTLWHGDAGVPLSSRAFDILHLLLEKRGRVVSKDEMMSQVWRGMIVEENNLAVQVSALRRALAAFCDTPLILTVPGQGYRFVGDVARPAWVAAPMPPSPQQPAPPREMPGIKRAPLPWKLTAAAAGGLATVAALILVLWPAAPAALPAAATAMPPPRMSIAVLPFRDLSDDRCCDYLADAVSDDLTTDLSHIPGSVVIARESSDAFRGRAVPTAEIGTALHVRYLLEGSLRAVDGQFSINAQLIEAASGAHLWAERFEVSRAHLGEAQQGIVRRLASALGVTLVDIEGARAAREAAPDPDALDLFLRARSVLDRSDDLAGLEQAQALLEQALAKQPDDIKVLSELGWLLPRKLNNFVDPHAADDAAEAHRVAARAVRLAPDDPAALAAQGAVLAHDGNCAEAQRVYQAALAADPANVRALTGSVVCHGGQAEFAGMAQGLEALLRIDPEGPRRRLRTQQLGFAYLMLGRAADAVLWLDRSTAGLPQPGPGAEDLGPAEWAALSQIAATRMAGDTARSDSLFAAYRAVWPHRTLWVLRAHTPRKLAESEGFAAFLAALRQAGMPPYAGEATDWGVAQVPAGWPHPPFSPTPMAAPGAATITTQALAALFHEGKPLVLDFGTGAAVPRGARLVGEDPARLDEGQVPGASGRESGRAIVVAMASGPLDWRGYDAAARLAGRPGLTVFWYRGGEEAWAQAGLPVDDRR